MLMWVKRLIPGGDTLDTVALQYVEEFALGHGDAVEE
jgi:hypothetical protein